MDIICPKCQYQRTVNDRGPEEMCPRCGIVYHKYIATQAALKKKMTMVVADDQVKTRHTGSRLFAVVLVVGLLLGLAYYRADVWKALEFLKVQAPPETKLFVDEWSCQLPDPNTVSVQVRVKNLSAGPLAIEALVDVWRVIDAGPDVPVGMVRGIPASNPIGPGEIQDFTFKETLDPNAEGTTSALPIRYDSSSLMVKCKLKLKTIDGQEIRHTERRGSRGLPSRSRGAN